jgi:1,5-anhydro-D-fructose reductase (1,5-anhydro-D-mannitol-forming)
VAHGATLGGMNRLETIRSRGEVRWGFIGCGDVTEVKSGPAFRQPGSRVVAVMRRNRAAAEDYARRHGIERASDDADAVIEASDVDAVYVATPPASHADYVLRAAAAGKCVYVEKPMAVSVAQGEAMVAACAAAEVPLWVAYYRRALPRFEFCRERLQQGAIGTPTWVECALSLPAPAAEQGGWRWDAAVAGDGLAFDLGSHAVDLLAHWFGNVEAVTGFAAARLGRGVGDQHVGALRFASGVLGVIAWDFAGRERRDAITVHGSAGTLSVPLFAEAPVRIDVDGRSDDHGVAHPAHVQGPLIASILAELRGVGRCPSTGASGLATQRVLAALQGGA